MASTAHHGSCVDPRTTAERQRTASSRGRSLRVSAFRRLARRLEGRPLKDAFSRAHTPLFALAVLIVACSVDVDEPEPEEAGDAAVMEHELDKETLWRSDGDDPALVAEEFLASVLGWSTEPAVRDQSDDDLVGEDDDGDQAGLDPRAITVAADGPDGQTVSLRLERGGPMRLGEGPPEDDRWRVASIHTYQDGTVIDEDANTLEVNDIPAERHHSVLLLHSDDDTRSYRLDDEDLESGTDSQELELATLGIDGLEPDASRLLATMLLVHFDEDGLALAVEGHALRSSG